MGIVKKLEAIVGDSSDWFLWDFGWLSHGSFSEWILVGLLGYHDWQ